eukprot:CAMPEP_0113941500 /NCGR_PEP_ID=MMETSP1339-20121228/7394_1 /TAXON_ID=94617 /ORGANISM="Fibrocapsa japonica" /LENGTH=289 /DNA_ID=CAMNT_0000945661 /DNA_START=198 /DNA_END=1067 /DNA_ORIENTATION=+ /assembly_acc=CAM_ASM_000762
MQSSANGGGGGKVYLVTGSTDGIGRHTCGRLAALAADGDSTVVVHGRDPARCALAVDWVREKSLSAGGGGCRVESIVADISTIRGVASLANQFKARFGRLDCLINNAGVFEQSYQLTEDNLEMTFAVNVMAPYLLTFLLLDLMLPHKGSRIINVSSISQGYDVNFDNLQFQNGGYSDHAAYSLSKLLMVMYSLESAERIGSPDLTINSLDPGTVNTKMLYAGWGACGIDVSRADNEFWLATSDQVEGINGRYFVGKGDSSASRAAYDSTNRSKLFEILEGITGVSYPKP